MKSRLVFFTLILTIAAAGVFTFPAEAKIQMKKQAFGKTADGEAVDLYTLTNSKGMEVQITNYGGIIVSLKTPDRAGKVGDVVLGFESLDGYLKPHPFFGALVGRYANRIAKGRFTLNGTEYKLAQNNGGNHIHGGARGFDKRVWKAREVSGGLELVYASKDGGRISWKSHDNCDVSTHRCERIEDFLPRINRQRHNYQLNESLLF